MRADSEIASVGRELEVLEPRQLISRFITMIRIQVIVLDHFPAPCFIDPELSTPEAYSTEVAIHGDVYASGLGGEGELPSPWIATKLVTIFTAVEIQHVELPMVLRTPYSEGGIFADSYVLISIRYRTEAPDFVGVSHLWRIMPLHKGLWLADPLSLEIDRHFKDLATKSADHELRSSLVNVNSSWLAKDGAEISASHADREELCVVRDIKDVDDLVSATREHMVLANADRVEHASVQRRSLGQHVLVPDEEIAL